MNKKEERRCRMCLFSKVRADESVSCDFILMTGRSRVKMGLLSKGPGRPCKAWTPRDRAEREAFVQDRRRNVFNYRVCGRTAEEYDTLPPLREGSRGAAEIVEQLMRRQRGETGHEQ